MRELRRTVLELLAVVVLTIATSATAQATSFTGTITETITATNTTDFQIGQTAVGLYKYDSPTVDGNFVSPLNFTGGPTDLRTLSGTIYTFSPHSPLFLQGDTGVSFDAIHLTVVNGAVTAFHYDGQDGPCSYGFIDFHFSVFCMQSLPFFAGGTGTGTLVFSAPTPSAATPEPSSSTLCLVGIAVGGFLAKRRQRVCVGR